MIGCNSFIAAAISAKRFAKRKVNVQADTIDMVLLAELWRENRFPLLHINCFIPKRHSRITGISWNRLVVFAYQQRINYFTFHLSKIKMTFNRFSPPFLNMTFVRWKKEFGHLTLPSPTLLEREKSQYTAKAYLAITITFNNLFGWKLSVFNNEWLYKRWQFPLYSFAGEGPGVRFSTTNSSTSLHYSQ